MAKKKPKKPPAHTIKRASPHGKTPRGVLNVGMTGYRGAAKERKRATKVKRRKGRQ